MVALFKAVSSGWRSIGKLSTTSIKPVSTCTNVIHGRMGTVNCTIRRGVRKKEEGAWKKKGEKKKKKKGRGNEGHVVIRGPRLDACNSSVRACVRACVRTRRCKHACDPDSIARGFLATRNSLGSHLHHHPPIQKKNRRREYRSFASSLHCVNKV